MENNNITNIHEAKTNLSKLIEQVLAGKEVIIGRAGKPVARLVAYDKESKKEPRKLGGWEGKVWIADNFDAEDPEIIAMFEGKDDENFN